MASTTGSSTTAPSSASTAGAPAPAAPASSSRMAHPMMSASGDAAVTSSSPTGHRPFSTGGLAALVFHPTTGLSSSMAGPPESLSAMASMPSGTAASSSSPSSDATFGQARLPNPLQWTKASRFFTSDTSGPPAMTSVWAMEKKTMSFWEANVRTFLTLS